MLKKITINSENRRFNISSIAIGYLEENKAEKIEFEIPKEYQNYGKKACFSANGTTFAKLFDNITSNVLTITRDISQYSELDLSIEFFKTENEDEIIARTSILHIVIENAVVCEDVKPDDEKVVILNELIEKVTNLDNQVTKNEEERQKNEQNRIQSENQRQEYIEDLKEQVENGDFNGKDAMINGVNTLNIIAGKNIGLEQKANILTISNTYDDSELKKDVQSNKTNIDKNSQEITDVKENYSLITETGNKISLTINSSTYVMTLQLKDKNSNVLSTGTIDLPLETMVVGATYNADTQEIELTLKNGSKVSFSVADLVDGLVNEDDLNTTLQDYALKTSIPTKLSQLTEDSTHRLVTDTEKATWNGKVDKVSGKGLSTNDFTNELKSKLDGIEDNAQVNKIEKISLDGVEQEIVEKEVNIKSYDINKYFYNALTYNQAKGNDLTFEDSIEFPLGKLDMDGKSEQATTTGSQLFDVSDNTFSPSPSITYDDEGWITINYTNTSDSERYVNVYTNVSEKLKPSTQYNVIIEVKDFTNAQGIGVVTVNQQNKGQFATTYTISSSEMVKGKKYSKICTTLDNFEGCVTMLRTFLTFTPSGVMSNTITFRISVIEDISVTTENFVYEPYTGEQPSPSPDFPQKITSIEGDLEYVEYGSKNLLNATRNEYTINGLTISADNNNMYINGIPTANEKIHTRPFKIPKGTYTLSLELVSGSITSTSSQNAALFYLYKDYTYNTINRDGIRLSDSRKQNYFSFTLEEDTNVNLSIFSRPSETFDNAVIQYQITKGESADYDFVPYKARTLTIPTNGQIFRKVGDVADKLVVDMKTGDYYKQGNIDYYNFTGNENYILSGSATEELLIIAIPSNPPFEINNNNNIICNRFMQSISLKIGTISVYNPDSNGIYASFRFCFDRTKYPNLEDGINYLKENNTYINFLKVTPTLEKIGTLTKEQLDMLVTFKGYNNVMINTNLGQADIDIEYVLDMKKYIDNKIAEISAQMI